MSLLSVCEQFDSNVVDSDAGDREASVSHDEILGVDLDDLTRLAVAQGLAAWNVCCAAWSIVLSRHTSQSGLEFLATGISLQDLQDIDKAKSWVQVNASVKEADTLSNFLHHSLKFYDKQALTDSTENLSLLVTADRVNSDEPLALPTALQGDADIALCVWSGVRKSIRVSCTHQHRLPQPFVRRVAHHFLQVLRQMTNRMAWSSLRIQDISMMSLEEEMQLRKASFPGRSLTEFTHGSVQQLVRMQARKTPSAPALEGSGHHVLSYQQMDYMSDLMAEDLRLRLADTNAQPLEAGPGLEGALVVGVMLQRSPNVVISILSCWKAGLAVVILDPTHPGSRNRHIIDDCECPMLLVDATCEEDDYFQIAWAYDFKQLLHRSEVYRHNPESMSDPNIDLMKDFFRLAWVKVTSGSTGKPKGVMHSHAALGVAAGSRISLRGTKTLLFLSPVSAASEVPIWGYLTNGGCVCILPQSELTSDLAGCINRYGIDDLVITPSALSLMTPQQVPGLKAVSLLGETVPRSVGTTWGSHVALRIDYGASEVNSHCYPLHDEPKGSLPPAIGFPTSDYSLYVLQPGSTTLCPFYVPGEICVSSTYLPSGYVKRADATSKSFVVHPFPGDAGHPYIYRTGDIGMHLDNQRFVVLGRVDFQFKIDGNRIQPEEIESMISQLPQVRKSKVVLVKPSTGRPVITCCVILREINSSGVAQKDAWPGFLSSAQTLCVDRLPAYMVPHRWLRFEKFPETPTSKTDTKVLAVEAKDILEKQDAASHDTSKQLTHHLSSRGKLFLDLVLETLTHETPDTLPADIRDQMQHQTFITNGGSSLVALKLMNQLRKQKIQLSQSQLYSDKSLANIAADIKDEGVSTDTCTDAVNNKSAVTEALLPRLPSSFKTKLDNVEAVFPTTMLQREMLVLSMLDRKQWILYQYFDFSEITCTESQMYEAVQELAAVKSNLRTVLSLVNVQSNPTMEQSALNALDLIKNGNFVQAILRPGFYPINITQEHEIEEPKLHWQKDHPTGWSFGQPLWRVAFLSKPRLLAFTLHHAIVDEWTIEDIPGNLRSILNAIMERDNGHQGLQQTLEDARRQARKPSIRPWIEEYYGTGGFDNTPDSLNTKHIKVWEDFMGEITPTYIPDTLTLPYEALPAAPLVKTVKNLSYGAWCRRYNITAASLFHAINALTIARILNWYQLPESSSNLRHETNDVTYYRVSSNRATTESVSEMEGTPISITPMRVPVSASAPITAVARSAMSNWLATYESDPYYLDVDPVPTGPGPTDKRRKWGNVVLNHIIEHEDPTESKKPTFRDAIEGRCGFAMVWAFSALEMAVVEVDSAKADQLVLLMYTTLEDEGSQEFMRVFEHTLELIVEGGENLTVEEVLRQT